MVTRVFYNDEKLLRMEVGHRWYEIMKYLGELYDKYSETALADEVMCLCIFESWYTFAILPHNEDRYIIFQEIDYYYNTWRHFISLALDKFYNSPDVLWVMGYTCDTFNTEYAELRHFGEDMMRRGLKMSPKERPFDVFMGRKRRKEDDYNLIDSELLFPSKSCADDYFRTLLGFAGLA